MALVVAALAWPATATAQDPGETTHAAVTSNGVEYPYIVYTPTTYKPGAPLYVMVHGCQTTAETQMKANLINPVAEREGFVVLYPDVDAIGRAQPGPLHDCWKFFYPPSYFRGNSDVAAIADMTRTVMANRAIDAERVYLVGLSAGGLMASAAAAAYADLYAAVAIVESAGYADGFCFTNGVGIPVELSAQLAHVAMGDNARVVPRFVIGSDADLAFPASCAVKALDQGLRTNNLVLSGSQTGPLALTPAAVREEQKPDGLAYTVSEFRDPAGCLVGQRWIIHGMPHAWPGGNPEYEGYVHTKAPSGAEGTWAFMKRYRKSDTQMPCAEAPTQEPAPTTCQVRTVTITLPRGARVRSVVALIAGRRIKTARRGNRVTLTLPAGRKRVVLKIRRHGAGRTQVLRRSFTSC